MTTTISRRDALKLMTNMGVATFAGGFALLATLFMNWWYIF